MGAEAPEQVAVLLDAAHARAVVGGSNGHLHQHLSGEPAGWPLSNQHIFQCRGPGAAGGAVGWHARKGDQDLMNKIPRSSLC